MAKSTAFYCRSAIRHEQLIDRNKKLLIDHAEKNNIAEYEFYVDNGFSGATADRPALNRLLKNIKDGNISEVLVPENNQLSRNIYDVKNLMKLFAENNVKYTSLQTGDFDAISLLAIPIESTEHEYEICEACHQLMESGVGCTVAYLKANGKKYKRIKAGDEIIYAGADKSDDVTCPTSNVDMGQYHHWYCDVEECPICHETLLD